MQINYLREKLKCLLELLNQFNMKNTLIITLTIFLLWSCGNQTNKHDKINIGVIMPLTGPVAEPGNNVLKGISIAAETFNNIHENKIQLIVEDSKSSPKDGVAALNKLIFSDKVKVVIGDIMSSVFLACAPIAERNQVVFFSPGASAPAVRDAGDYIFRNYLSDDFDGRIMANYILREKSYKSVGIISVNNDYGVGINKTFTEEFKKMGGELIFNEQYAQGETNFRTMLTKCKESKVEAIYMVCNPTESGYLVKQMKELNIKTQLFGNLSFENNEFISIAKGYFDDIIFSAPYLNLEDNNDVTKEFVTSFEKKYNIKPDIAAALGYDVATIIMHTLTKIEFDISKLKDELYKTNYIGVTGKTSFDKKGDVLKDIYIKRITGEGKIEIIKLFGINE